MKVKKIFLYGGLITTLLGSIKIYKMNETYNKFIEEIEIHNDSIEHNSNIVAHRGFSSLYVENSFEAIDYSFKSDCVDEVEVDIRLTKDNEIVLMHNACLEFNCCCGDFVENKTLEELKQYKCYNSKIIPFNIFSPDMKLIDYRNKENAKNYSCITTLNEILEKIDSDKSLILDVKIEDNREDMIKELGNILSIYDGNIVIKIQSTDEEFLKEIKKIYPNYNYQIVISSDIKINYYINSDYDSLVIKYNVIDENIVKRSIKNDKDIYVWTINNYKQYMDLKNELGDYMEYVTIISDNPDVMCFLNNCDDKKLTKLKK